MDTYKNTQQLYHLVVRTSKNDSMYVYFILESNEGICFYSTLEQSLGQTYRDVEIYCPIEFMQILKNLVANIQKSIKLEILVDKIIIDSQESSQ